MKNADIELLTGSAGFAHTLGSAPRLQLLKQIAQGEFAVEQLVALTGLSVANTSQHLQQLRRAGFVQARRDGKRVLYRLGSGPVVQLLAALAQPQENPAASAQLEDSLRHVLDQMTSLDRRVIELRLLGHSTVEVAEQLGQDARVLRARLSRLRQKLREQGVLGEWL